MHYLINNHSDVRIDCRGVVELQLCVRVHTLDPLVERESLRDEDSVHVDLHRWHLDLQSSGQRSR